MPIARDYRLTEKELQAVETAIRRDKRPEVRQRCTALRLLHLGHKPAQVAEMQAVSSPAIYAWITRWRRGGIAALANQPRSGRPPKADEAYVLLLGEVIEQEPAALGYGFTVWTVERLGDHLARETGIELRESRLRALLKREGYRYRRTKHALSHLQDPEAKEQAAELLEELKKRSSETISSSSLWTKRR